MCIIAVAYRIHPSYPVIIAANRDEFYSRPTAPLHFWDDKPDILAGRDLQSHGTWLGVNKQGKIAAVTNYRDPESQGDAGISRGRLVSDYLAENSSPVAYLEKIAAQKDQYNGFNLVAGTVDSLFWYSNRGGGIKKITQGIHAISNHLLNTSWPKVEKIKQGMADIISDNKAIDREIVFGLLKDRSIPPDELLPDTGIEKSWERVLSPVFIASETYGTRCSSLITIDNYGKIMFSERTFDYTQPVKTLCFELDTKEK